MIIVPFEVGDTMSESVSCAVPECFQRFVPSKALERLIKVVQEFGVPVMTGACPSCAKSVIREHKHMLPVKKRTRPKNVVASAPLPRPPGTTETQKAPSPVMKSPTRSPVKPKGVISCKPAREPNTTNRRFAPKIPDLVSPELTRNKLAQVLALEHRFINELIQMGVLTGKWSESGTTFAREEVSRFVEAFLMDANFRGEFSESSPLLRARLSANVLYYASLLTSGVLDP